MLSTYYMEVNRANFIIRDDIAYVKEQCYSTYTCTKVNNATVRYSLLNTGYITYVNIWHMVTYI